MYTNGEPDPMLLLIKMVQMLSERGMLVAIDLWSEKGRQRILTTTPVFFSLRMTVVRLFYAVHIDIMCLPTIETFVVPILVAVATTIPGSISS